MEDGHSKSTRDEFGIPEIHVDYCFGGSIVGEETLTMMVARDRDSRMTLSEVVPSKGASDSFPAARLGIGLWGDSINIENGPGTFYFDVGGGVGEDSGTRGDSSGAIPSKEFGEQRGNRKGDPVGASPSTCVQKFFGISMESNNP